VTYLNATFARRRRINQKRNSAGRKVVNIFAVNHARLLGETQIIQGQVTAIGKMVKDLIVYLS
jgi:ribosomal protein L18E